MKSKIKKYVSIDEALLRLRKYCAYQERCHQDVRKKLLDLGIYGDDLEDIITELITDKYLNETRFAESFVRGKFKINRWSKAKIRIELKRKSISDYNIKKGLLEISEEAYAETIAYLIEKKKRTIRDDNPLIIKKKLLNYMLQKGYTYNEVKHEL